MRPALVFMLLAAGCSFFGVRGPFPSPRECTAESILPELDLTAGAVATVTAGLIVRSELEMYGDGWVGGVGFLLFVPTAALGITSLVSGLHGVSKRSACRGWRPPTVPLD